MSRKSISTASGGGGGRWHVNPATGKPGRCSASSADRCPFGGPEVHSATREEAIEKYEKESEAAALRSATRRVSPKPVDILEQGRVSYFNTIEDLARSPRGKTPGTAEHMFAVASKDEDPAVRERAREAFESMKSCERQLDRMRRGESLDGLEMAHRSDDVEKVCSFLVDHGMETDKNAAFASRDFGGIEYNEERREDQQEIIAEYMNDVADRVPRQGKVLFSGGLGGAGKSTVLRSFAGIDQTQYATLNPDDVKESMAEKGMIPPVPGLLPMEASTLVHNEASQLTDDMRGILVRQKRNICFDMTMGSYSSVENRASACKEKGYTEFKAIFVDISTNTSHSRARSRYRNGMQKAVSMFQQGENPMGGRHLPARIIDGQKTPPDSPIHSTNALMLIRANDAGIFTEPPRVFDNDVDGRDPQEVQFSDLERRGRKYEKMYPDE